MWAILEGICKMIITKQLDELKNLKQWVCFKKETRNGKITKIPKNPATGDNASSNNPNTWGTYKQAVEAAARFNYDGVGFNLVGGYFAIDLDHVIDRESNRIEPYAISILKLMNSYTEISPSGTGLHIICKGEKPQGRSRNDKLEIYQAITNSDGTISNGRYITVTGNVYIDRPIENRTKEAAELFNRYFKEEKAEPHPVATSGTDQSDAEIINKALRARNGATFAALWQGDYTAYPSQSEADLALCNLLAYWTQGDADRIDSLFRQSGLYDNMKTEKGGIKKWDKKRGAITYGQLTINKALENYTPYAPKSGHTEALYNNHSIITNERKNALEQANNEPSNVLQYLQGGYLKKSIQEYSKHKDRKTGYSNLDSVQPLYPGLYVLGAISSLGKTTFLHQMADQIAKAGDHVLYFSLEQSKLEMITKGLARITAQQNINTAVSAIDIRRGNITPAVENAIKQYETFAGNINVIECSFNTNIDYIVNTVKEFIDKTGITPVVIVDYLQIIPPSDTRLNTKDAVDMHVRAFKQLQRNNNLVLFLISSLNRSNYLTPVDFESFKETGGIEFTADVVMGLQLACMNENNIFNKEGQVKEKRDAIKEAKKAIPRDIELVILKNRYGIANYSCRFTYNPVYDLFTENTQEEKPQINTKRI